jgi:hypothetical protein
MADDVKDLTVRLTLDNAKLKKGLKDTETGFNRTEKAQSKLSKGIGKLKLGYIALAGVLGGVIVAGFKKAITSAIDFQEANSKFATIFEGVEKAANKARNTLVRSYGQSKLAATELLSSTGDVLSGIELEEQAVLDLSTAINKQAIDVASFSNARATDVSAAFTKALLGERESLKTYGIAIQEADVQARLFQKGQDNLTGSALKQAKAYATLELIQESSAKATGDFARTQDGVANTLKVMSARFEDFKLIAGTVLLKVFTPLIKKFNEFINTEEGLNTITVAFKVMAGVVSVFVGLLKIAKNNIEIMFAPFIQLVKTIVDVGDALTDTSKSMIDRFKSLKNVGIENFTEMKESISEDITDIGNVFKDTYDEINNITKSSVDEQIKGIEKVTDAQKKALQERKDALIEKEQTELAGSAIGLGAAATGLQAVRASNEEILNIIRASKDEQQMMIEELAKKRIETEEEITEAVEKEQERRREKAIAIAEFSKDLTQQGLELFSSIQDLRIAKIDQEKRALRKKNEDGLISDEAYAQGVDALDKKRAKELKKQFIADKVSKILDIAAKTAVGIQGVWAQFGAYPPVAAALSAVVGSIGAANTGVVAAQKVPAFANGGVIRDVAPANIAGEDGLIAARRGEAVLNQSATTELGEDTINALNSGQGMMPSINITVQNGEGAVDTLNDYFRQYGGAREVGVG